MSILSKILWLLIMMLLSLLTTNAIKYYENLPDLRLDGTSTYDSGTIKLSTYFSPTLNFHNDSTGLRYGISIDNETPQIISINKEDNNTRTWEQWVANNIIIKTWIINILHNLLHL